jgi:hypothetical protein
MMDQKTYDRLYKKAFISGLEKDFNVKITNQGDSHDKQIIDLVRATEIQAKHNI